LYPKDKGEGDTLLTLETPGNPLRYTTPQSAYSRQFVLLNMVESFISARTRNAGQKYFVLASDQDRKAIMLFHGLSFHMTAETESHFATHTFFVWFVRSKLTYKVDL